jgi:hypothetical protein
MGAPSEDAFDGEPAVELAAHDGPNGAYVGTTGDGELEIDVTDPGVNPEALTEIESVFDITNTDTTDVEVWVTHDGGENVTLEDAAGTPIDDSSGSVTLGPGERITVSIDIDSTGAEAGDALLSTVTLHAEYEPAAEDTGPTGPGAGGPVAPTEPVEPDGTTEVIFDDATEGIGGADDGAQIRSVDPSELDTDPQEDVERPPLAVISSSEAETRADDPTGGGADAPDAAELEAADYDTLTLVGEPTELSGERSKIGSAEAISTRDRLTQLVDIDVPPERENQPATVRMRVDRDRLGDIDGEATKIGHRTDEGWELLETSVVERTDETITVEAQTPGFSMFAVFSPPNVEYTWKLPDGTEIGNKEAGPCLCANPTFEEPGFYDVQLTVTDRFGRQSTATHRVLANDVPEATIEVVDRDGDEVTLAANVDDEIGETELTWTFPDGTEATGEEVTHTLEGGEHRIGLHVIDEYGAESETEHIVAVGPTGASVEGVVDALGMDLELLVQVGLVSGIGAAIAIGYRQFPWKIFAMKRRRGPKITEFRRPRIELDARRFLIDELTVTDPSRELETIRIKILDKEGHTVVEKRIDISGTTTYSATPETISVPPGIDVRSEESYTVGIKVTDTGGKSTERHSTATTVLD